MMVFDACRLIRVRDVVQGQRKCLCGVCVVCVCAMCVCVCLYVCTHVCVWDVNVVL